MQEAPSRGVIASPTSRLGGDGGRSLGDLGDLRGQGVYLGSNCLKFHGALANSAFHLVKAGGHSGCGLGNFGGNVLLRSSKLRLELKCDSGFNVVDLGRESVEWAVRRVQGGELLSHRRQLLRQ
eukprot:jgi/Mesvir1/9195/Mv25588-RA.1